MIARVWNINEPTDLGIVRVDLVPIDGVEIIGPDDAIEIKVIARALRENEAISMTPKGVKLGK